MSAVLAAMMKAIGQLGDRAVVAVLVKSVAVTLVLFAVAGAGLYAAIPLMAESEWFAALIPPVIGGPLLIAAMVLVALVAFWLLFRVVALMVLQFFADEVVAAVEARHYPALAERARPLPLAREVSLALRGLLRVLGYNLLALPLAVLLLFTAIGPGLVFLGVNAVLMGREFTDMAWVRHCGPGGERANPVPWGERVLLGAGVAGLMLVPLVNFLAPVIGAAAGTHLVLRRIAADGGAA
ncbi:EI24 domain-containing protein [Erythrobacter sp. BLCC-B19]|uniref:EI24 domain-containing protein n=1 Tax=Erythrobacter sp. BLCC-B19 TaxID=3025315 RepID=UPI0023607E18|nr:EI24 domain-containing protein [Erythrobacter sp. BLCC-B19]WDA42449.1 EI24 domain-containing protein [Erythrobacter sp. BLCC-B19]